MSAYSSLLLLIIIWDTVQDGVGHPVVQQLEPKGINGDPSHPVRTRRCACSNPLDSECHYFCHMDIIWINTPSKTTLYGLGSSLLRRKRSADRCACAKPDDQTCKGFCLLWSRKTPPLDILSTLRAAADNSNRVQDAQHSGGDESSQAHRKII